MKELYDYLESIKLSTPLPHSRHSLSLWHKLQDGILYQAGGWSNQPSWYVDDMGYIDLLVEYEEIPYKVAECIKQIDNISKQTPTGVNPLQPK